LFKHDELDQEPELDFQRLQQMQHDKQRAMSVMRRLQREDEQVMD